MSKGKAVLLVLAFVLPVSIFLFLKFFGRNEFAVEPLYIRELPETAGRDCSYGHALPYSVPENILTQLSWTRADSLTLFCIRDGDQPAVLKRLLEAFDRPLVHTVLVGSDSSAKTDPGVTAAQATAESLDHWKKCFFFMEEPNDLFLVDNQRRIRGYYQLANREEVDRLVVELSIILKLY
jgi:hypothetical protein